MPSHHLSATVSHRDTFGLASCSRFMFDYRYKCSFRLKSAPNQYLTPILFASSPHRTMRTKAGAPRKEFPE